VFTVAIVNCHQSVRGSSASFSPPYLRGLGEHRRVQLVQVAVVNVEGIVSVCVVRWQKLNMDVTVTSDNEKNLPGVVCDLLQVYWLSGPSCWNH